MKPKIGIFGTYLADRAPRSTIGPALIHSASALGISVDYEWLGNDRITPGCLKDFNGVFIAPGSALEDSEKILGVIQHARENRVPCLGTCGGFQRILTEYALHVLGHENVVHEERSPDAVDPLFSKLQCSISSSLCEVKVNKDSIAHQLYQRPSVLETHYCHYGLNPKYENAFLLSGMKITGTAEQGIARIIELPHHPFFMGTLFVPQVSSTPETPHPILSAFIAAVARPLTA